MAEYFNVTAVSFARDIFIYCGGDISNQVKKILQGGQNAADYAKLHRLYIMIQIIHGDTK